MNRHILDFLQTTRELLESDQVRMMGRWKHHGPISTLDHSLLVAYLSYRAAKVLGLDARAAARGGLLHDLYLYDSKDKSAHPGWQCFDHPRAAARNAGELTWLSDKERNIILSHMWPLGGAGGHPLRRTGNVPRLPSRPSAGAARSAPPPARLCLIFISPPPAGGEFFCEVGGFCGEIVLSGLFEKIFLVTGKKT